MSILLKPGAAESSLQEVFLPWFVDPIRWVEGTRHGNILGAQVYDVLLRAPGNSPKEEEDGGAEELPGYLYGHVVFSMGRSPILDKAVLLVMPANDDGADAQYWTADCVSDALLHLAEMAYPDEDLTAEEFLDRCEAKDYTKASGARLLRRALEGETIGTGMVADAAIMLPHFLTTPEFSRFQPMSPTEHAVRVDMYPEGDAMPDAPDDGGWGFGCVLVMSTIGPDPVTCHRAALVSPPTCNMGEQYHLFGTTREALDTARQWAYPETDVPDIPAFLDRLIHHNIITGLDRFRIEEMLTAEAAS